MKEEGTGATTDFQYSTGPLEHPGAQQPLERVSQDFVVDSAGWRERIKILQKICRPIRKKSVKSGFLAFEYCGQFSAAAINQQQL